jgi:non-specific serine/threonine protein kinase/serine/threonine-protein kinase
MECLPGTTLADELASGPLPEARVRTIALDIAGALQAAHDLGIVHRDVKPGNILVTTDGRVKLADFGIAWSADRMDQTQTGLVIGTPAYLAPERLGGEPATPETDLYSLGVVLFEALVGERPFPGDSPVALAHAIHVADRPSLATVRPGTDTRLATAVDAAIARSPADRPGSAAEFAAAIDGPRRTEPVTVAMATLPATAQFEPATAPARPAPPPTPSNPRPTGSRAWLALTLVVAAVLVAGVVLAGAIGVGDEPAAPSTTTTSAAPTAAPSLPPPLEDALQQLETSVQR